MFPLKYNFFLKLTIGKRKCPVGQPRKHVPAAEPTSLVDYSSSDTDDDEPSEPLPSKKLCIKCILVDKRARLCIMQDTMAY